MSNQVELDAQNELVAAFRLIIEKPQAAGSLSAHELGAECRLRDDVWQAPVQLAHEVATGLTKAALEEFAVLSHILEIEPSPTHSILVLARACAQLCGLSSWVLEHVDVETRIKRGAVLALATGNDLVHLPLSLGTARNSGKALVRQIRAGGAARNWSVHYRRSKLSEIAVGDECLPTEREAVVRAIDHLVPGDAGEVCRRILLGNFKLGLHAPKHAREKLVAATDGALELRDDNVGMSPRQILIIDWMVGHAVWHAVRAYRDLFGRPGDTSRGERVLGRWSSSLQSTAGRLAGGERFQGTWQAETDGTVTTHKQAADERTG